MPSMRKLEAEEVQSLEHKGDGVRAAIAMEYDGYLAEFEPNDWGEALLAEDESKLNVRNRLQSAAKRRGWTLDFRRTKGPIVFFKVISENGDEATEVFSAAHDEQEETEELAVAA